MGLPSITITGHAQKEAWLNKVVPPVEKLGRDVWSVPIPFPDNPMRYTVSYLLLSDGDAVLSDPGWDSDAGLDHLAAGLRQAGLGLTDLTGIVLIHFHSDHLGMAGRLRTASGAWAALGDREVRRLTASDDLDLVPCADREDLTLWGVPPGRLAEVAMNRPGLIHLQNLAAPRSSGCWRRIGPGLSGTLPGTCPGHAAESPCRPCRCAWRSPKQPATLCTCARRVMTSTCPSPSHAQLFLDDGKLIVLATLRAYR